MYLTSVAACRFARHVSTLLGFTAMLWYACAFAFQHFGADLEARCGTLKHTSGTGSDAIKEVPCAEAPSEGATETQT